MLQPQLGVSERANEQKRPGSSFGELRCYDFPIYSRRCGYCRHDISPMLGTLHDLFDIICLILLPREMQGTMTGYTGNVRLAPGVPVKWRV